MKLQTRGAAVLALERRSRSASASRRSSAPRSTTVKSLRSRVSDLPVAVVHAIRPIFAAPSMLSILMRRAALDLPFVFPREAP